VSEFPWPDQPASAGEKRSATSATTQDWAGTAVAGLLLVFAAGLHVAAMFPAYPGSPAKSVISSPDQTAIYICLEVGWALASFLVLSRLSARGGIALAASLGLVEIGFLFTDTASGLQVSNDSAPGIWLAWAGLIAGLAGVCLGASGLRMLQPARALPRPSFVVRAGVTVPVAIVAVAAYWPSWDHYHLVGTSGRTIDITIGNAFAPTVGSWVTTGEVIAGVAIGALAIVAALWSPSSVGAWAMGGVVIALGSQLISGLVQVHEPLTATLGSNLSGVNLSASSLWLTAYWSVDVAAAAALTCLAVWAGLESRATPLSAAPDNASGNPSNGVAITPLGGQWHHSDELDEHWPAPTRWPGT